MMGTSDHTRIEQCLAGNADAQQSLYAQFGRRVKSYLLRSGFRPADADDLTQEVFLRVFRSLGTYKSSRGAFGSWLMTITKNVARKQWRKRPQPNNYDPQLAEETLLDDCDPTQETIDQEHRLALSEGLAALPDALREILTLRYVDALTTRGIAEHCSIPESTVRLRLREAMGLLTTSLREKGVDGL